MRRPAAIIILWFVACTITAQTYSNSWINYAQQYFKIPVYKEGIYRIDSATLASYYNLNTLDPKNFQLFLKGREQFIYINGEADGKINTGDFIEFYANPLMGDVDSLLYTNIKYLPNPYAGIFNDTIYAFITVNNSSNNKRFVLETDVSFGSYPAADHFYTEKIYAPAPQYNAVQEYAYDVSDPHYTQAEGRGFIFAKGSAPGTPFSGLNPYTASALPAYASVVYSGMSLGLNSGDDHEISISYSDQGGNTVQLADTSFRGFVPVRKRFNLNAQSLGSASNFSLTSVAAPQFGSAANSTMLHYIYLFYPQTLSFNNEWAYRLMPDDNSSAPKSFYNFSGFNTTPSGSVLFFDLTNGKRISTVTSGAQVKVLVPNGQGRKVCYMTEESRVTAVTSFVKVSPNDYFTNYQNLAGNNPYLLVYHNSLQSSVSAYKNYRGSSAGGSYNVVSANIDELYEQFAYGINKHPLAIKNFAAFLNGTLAIKPRYLLIIGKGVEPSQLNSSSQVTNLVPTMGIPASDNLLSANLLQPLNSNFFPDIPIGRIAATTNSQVSNYLTKVQQIESSGPEDWKKEVLHFVGGDTPNLAATLESYMNSYKQIITDTLFGAAVYTFKKNTTAPIQTSISDSIKNTINRGAALLDFFGHGSEDGFDQAIDDPETYSNTGKYPFVIANSCYSGDIHLPFRTSVSEKFVFSNQKGSIGFLAATSYGFVNALNNYTNQFYTALSVTRYNQGIGDVIRESARLNALSGDDLVKITSLDMTLHGDPAVKITNGTLPDYQLKNNDVYFNLKKYSDSIGIRINIKNSGKAVRDSFIVKVERLFPNGDSSVTLKKIKAPLFRDSLVFFMTLDFDRGIGLNKFKVKLDEFNEVTESIKTNNSTVGTVDLFIPGGDILPVYPYKYAIVPKTNTITLKASTTDPFAPSGTYRFQLDTNDKFLAPIQATLITSRGGVLKWTVTLPLADSAVYFWRVSRDSISPASPFLWKESSFQTIATQHGWSQAHFNQFKNNSYQFVNYKKTQRQFAFENNKQSIFCRDGIQPTIVSTNIAYFFNNINYGYWSCAPDGWNFAVFDSISGQPQPVTSVNYPNIGMGQYNNPVCVDNQVLYVYSFGATPYLFSLPNWKADMENFLNSVAPNNYVLAFTVGAFSPGYAQISSYSNTLYSAFESIGAGAIRSTPDTVPYILFGRKGMSAGQGHEVIGATQASIITLDDSIKTRWNNGYIASEIIGPSYGWKSLHWRVRSLDNNAGDTTILKIVGIKANGQTDTLGRFPKDSSDVQDLYNYVDASVYPFMKLVAFMQDNVNRTSPQLKRWQVLYDQAPECAINPLNGFTSVNDTLQEGDVVTFKFPIENIGTENFNDSLLVTYWIEDNNRNKILLPQKMKARPFVPGQVIVDTVSINSYQYSGNNAIWIYVNPPTGAKYQKEQALFNNIGRYPFRVNKDVSNPLLDVTFDGVRILNGDIVSSKPTILVTLKDENKFLALNDTGAFSVFLQAPDQSTQQRIYFAQGLQFIPASLPKNSCSIIYTPTLPVDGKYTLIVQAKDRSNNISGAQDYRIQFEISNKPSITGVLNYPNPFSTSTRFVFTLTGSEIPEVFTIQIMTITGKIVKEITRGELGNLHIGRNITDYAWDGKDNYGDRLGNGVYLYRVVTRLNGSSIEKSASGADKYFVKDFGKMVLMR